MPNMPGQTGTPSRRGFPPGTLAPRPSRPPRMAPSPLRQARPGPVDETATPRAGWECQEDRHSVQTQRHATGAPMPPATDLCDCHPTIDAQRSRLPTPLFRHTVRETAYRRHLNPHSNVCLAAGAFPGAYGPPRSSSCGAAGHLPEDADAIGVPCGLPDQVHEHPAQGDRLVTPGQRFPRGV